VPAAEADVLASLAGYEEQISVAAVNGPNATVLSGEAAALEEWRRAWEPARGRVQRLRVSHAFHSARMDPMLEEFRAVAEALTYAPPQLPVISNVTGRPAEPDELTDPGYWVRHVRATVRFADGVRAAQDLGAEVFVEVGPGGALTGTAGESLAGDVALVAALPGPDAEPDAVPAAAAALFVHGAEVDRGRFTTPQPRVDRGR